MDPVGISSLSAPSIILVEQDVLKDEFLANRSISRLGWISFILGFCAFLLHYLSVDQLAKISPINAGMISGLFLIIAGLMSIQVGYRERSVRHARWSSLIASLVFAPGLILVSLVALVLESEEFTPPGPTTLPSSQAMLFGNSFEVHAATLPCINAVKLTDLAQMINMMQLIIGIASFFIHIALLSMQGKVLERLTDNEKFHLNGTPHSPGKRVTGSSAVALSHEGLLNRFFRLDSTASPMDPPPKYEDLPQCAQSP